MLKFVGLNHHLAIIRYVNTGENEGGNIELDHSDNVFIEINKSYRFDENKVLAVMAHEICHKVLFVNGLYYPEDTIENELLTDLATIYVGFGKLSLNGCYDKKEEKTEKYQNGQFVEETKTHIHTIGYLSLRQFAVAYNYVCSSYGVTDSDKRRGLGKYALEMVDSIQLPIFNCKIDELKEILKKVQQSDAEIVNSIVIIESLLSQIKNRIKQHHKQFREEIFLPFNYSENECLPENQLTAMDVILKYEDFKTDDDTKEIHNVLLGIINELKETKVCNFQEAVNNLLSIECSNCGYKKQNALKEHKQLFVRCPNCKDLFLWNGNDALDNNKESLFSRLKKFVNK